MSVLDKLKNMFFEEEADGDDDKEELAKKVEIPKIKKNIKDVKEEAVDVMGDTVNDTSKDTIVSNSKEEKIVTNQAPIMFEEEDFLDEKDTYFTDNKETVKSDVLEKKDSYSSTTKSKLYGGSDYNTSYTYSKSKYESKETKIFKPSPIISPIYGILDKNYKKEEVVTKKEIRISSNKKVDLDTVRNKALGNVESNDVSKKDPKREKEESFYDVNTSKPSVDKVTLADADEYYSDLGLAYNVDYSDKSRTISNSHKKEEKVDKKDDNLFDLIESMYKED